MILNKLQKLREKSADEWLSRGSQELAKWQERLLGTGCAPLTDAALQQAFTPAARQSSASQSVTALLQRISTQPNFLPAFNQRAQVVTQLQADFPAEAQRVIERADAVCAGSFTIFQHDQLDFGAPVDWHREPQAGKRTPLAHWSKINYLDPQVAGDKKFTWELNRHQFLITLGQAYWLTGDEKYAARFVELVEAWIVANPPKQGINWASSLELAFRVIAWVWALHFFAGANSLTPAFAGRMLKSLIQQTAHVETYLSHYFSPNTHLTGEALALLYVGTALPELAQAARWQEGGERILLEQLPRHVGRDGVYFEQASYYHRYTADFYTHLLLLSRASQRPLPALVNEKLAGLHEHLLWITRPDGSSPFYGDDDGGRMVMLSDRRADDFRDTLAIGAALFDRADWKFVAGPSVEMLWLLGAEDYRRYRQMGAQVPPTGLKAFPDSGYVVMRDGWTNTAGYVLVDCGKHGAMNCGHAHSDALSFEFAAGGANWLMDPGTFTYTGNSAWRNEIRSSFSHNTVSVDGESQSIPNTAFTWRHIAQSLIRECRDNDAASYVAGQQNGYTRLSDPVRHRRSFTFLKNNFAPASQLIVRDEIEAQTAHRYAAHFHFAPECAVVIEHERQARVSRADGKTLWLCWQMRSGELRDKPSMKLTQGWISRCYGQRETAQVLTVSFAANAAVTWETLLISDAQMQQAGIEKVIEAFSSNQVNHEYC